MTDRLRFPTRRQGEAFNFECDGLSYRAMVNRLPEDGEIAELFFDGGGRVGSTANTIIKECAVLFSIARQYGAPMRVLMDALPKLADGSAAGPTGTALALADAPAEAPL